LSANFRGKGGRPPTTFGVRKLVPGLVCVILRLAVLIQYRRVTHTHTHTHTQTNEQTANDISTPLGMCGQSAIGMYVLQNVYISLMPYVKAARTADIDRNAEITLLSIYCIHLHVCYYLPF